MPGQHASDSDLIHVFHTPVQATAVTKERRKLMGYYVWIDLFALPQVRPAWIGWANKAWVQGGEVVGGGV